jgi:hypothetical protein
MSDLNSRAGYHGVVPVQLFLKAGDVNTVRFGASGQPGMSQNIFIPKDYSAVLR